MRINTTRYSLYIFTKDPVKGHLFFHITRIRQTLRRIRIFETDSPTASTVSIAPIGAEPTRTTASIRAVASGIRSSESVVVLVRGIPGRALMVFRLFDVSRAVRGRVEIRVAERAVVLRPAEFEVPDEAGDGDGQKAEYLLKAGQP